MPTKKVTKKTLAVVKKYMNCTSDHSEHSTPSGCENPKIMNFHILSTPHNVGFSGSCNMAIKAMMQFDLRYAMFSGDDIRFLPERIGAAKRIIDLHPDVCLFHFEGFSSFAISRGGIKKIGPFDENFWPAYAEDCDYWFRSILVGCSMFYRGGYSPVHLSSPKPKSAYVDHGDVKNIHTVSSVTMKSDASIDFLVKGTLNATRGRRAYLIRKWGLDVCDYYHHVINQWRNSDEILIAENSSELADHYATVFIYPYNDPIKFGDVRRWLTDDWKIEGAISSRAVNHLYAPSSLVWREEDYLKLDRLHVLYCL